MYKRQSLILALCLVFALAVSACADNNITASGGSGSGKTRFFIKPNLMQLHSSYVVTDPKGQLVLELSLIHI